MYVTVAGFEGSKDAKTPFPVSSLPPACRWRYELSAVPVTTLSLHLCGLQPSETVSPTAIKALVFSN